MFVNDFVVKSDFILKNRYTKDFVVIDARGDMLKCGDFVYDRAVVLDWKEFTFLNGKDCEHVGLYFQKDVLAKKFLKYNIDKNSKVLIYIDTRENCGMGEDGRFKFLLNIIGIDAYILDGGINEVLKTNFVKEITDESMLKESDIDLESLPFLEYEKSILTKELLDIYKNDNVKILDVRYEKEYNGDIIFGERFGGHIKGAISFPYTKIYDSSGYLLSNDEIENLIFNKGISKKDDIIVYCTTGIRASIVYEVLNMLNFNVKIYDESFSRWCIVGDYEI